MEIRPSRVAKVLRANTYSILHMRAALPQGLGHQQVELRSRPGFTQKMLLTQVWPEVLNSGEGFSLNVCPRGWECGDKVPQSKCGAAFSPLSKLRTVAENKIASVKESTQLARTLCRMLVTACPAIQWATERFVLHAICKNNVLIKKIKW